MMRSFTALVTPYPHRALADQDKDSRLSLTEFAACMHLVHAAMASNPVPDILPDSLKVFGGGVEWDY